MSNGRYSCHIMHDVTAIMLKPMSLVDTSSQVRKQTSHTLIYLQLQATSSFVHPMLYTDDYSMLMSMVSSVSVGVVFWTVIVRMPLSTLQDGRYQTLAQYSIGKPSKAQE